jgi:hypothetical protein
LVPRVSHIDGLRLWSQLVCSRDQSTDCKRQWKVCLHIVLL